MAMERKAGNQNKGRSLTLAASSQICVSICSDAGADALSTFLDTSRAHERPVRTEGWPIVMTKSRGRDTGPWRRMG